jgi:hypothetical protein
VPHRLKSVLVIVLVSFLLPASALAHDVPKLPAHVQSAVVRVDAYEHSTLGAVIGDGRLVLVPFEAIEVARPGFPHAFVIDANGVRHGAGVAATDREAGLALLAVEHPLTTTPLALSPSTLSDPIDTFAMASYSDDHAWSFYPAGALAAEGKVAHPAVHPSATMWPPRAGSPIVDVEGRLVGLMSGGTFLMPRPIGVSASVLARLDGSQRARRPLIFYGGMTIPFSFAPDGGLWFGLGLGFGARVRDVLELRLDAEFSALVPTKSAPEGCSGKCYAGIRGVATPSIGYRYVLGGVGGARAWPIAVTPSLGLALGLQDTSRDNGAPLRDALTPSAWAEPAPGLALSVSWVELRGRVRIPIDDARSPTTELSLGITF